MTEVQDGRAEDIIKALTEKIEVTRILALRPKRMREYEITLEHEEDTEKLLDGLTIKGKICEIKKLHNRDFVVSFMHLPAYMNDDEILNNTHFSNKEEILLGHPHRRRNEVPKSAFSKGSGFFAIQHKDGDGGRSSIL